MDTPLRVARASQRLRDLALAAPTPAAAAHAAEVLVSLAREGLVAPTVALLQALGTELGLGSLPELSACETMAEIGAAPLPALLRVYARALCPRDFLLGPEPLPTGLGDASIDAGFAGLRDAVRRRAPLQHEALRAHLLLALARFRAATAHVSDTTLPGHAIFQRVVGSGRVVEGGEADDSLAIGRDLVLQSGLARFLFIVTHEFGHITLDATVGRKPPAAMSTRDELTALAEALPAWIAAAVDADKAPLGPSDPRCLVLPSHVELLATVRSNARAEYLHFSISHGGAPMALADAAPYAYLVGCAASPSVGQAAFAWSRGGILHAGIAPVAPINAAIAAPRSNDERAAWVEAALADSAGWAAHLASTRRLFEDEDAVARAMGFTDPKAVALHAADPRAFDDWERVRLPRQVAVDADATAAADGERSACIAASVRVGEVAVLDAVLRGCADPAAALRAAGVGASQVGVCVGALRFRSELWCRVPSLASVRRCLRLLVANGADADGRDVESGKRGGPSGGDGAGSSLLAYAVRRDSVGSDAAATAFALRLGVAADGRPGDAEPPLLAAAACGSLAAAKLLLAAGAHADAHAPGGDTALHLAAARGDTALISSLLDADASVDRGDRLGATALARVANAATVTCLVARDAGVDASGPDGRTALMEAAGDGRLDAATALLGHGASVDAATSLGETALHFAAGTDAALHAPGLVGLLIDAGAAIDDDTDAGETALMLAARQAAVEAVRVLIARGAALDARSSDGATAMRQAADGRNVLASRDPSFCARIEQVLRLLAEAGAAIDLADDHGSTPLIAASWGIDAGRVRLLLELGADPARARGDGRTALDFARAQKHGAMTEMLLAAMSASLSSSQPASPPEAGPADASTSGAAR